MNISLTYRVHPSILAKANVVADTEEKAGVPVDQDQDEHHHLRHKDKMTNKEQIFFFRIKRNNRTSWGYPKATCF